MKIGSFFQFFLVALYMALSSILWELLCSVIANEFIKKINKIPWVWFPILSLTAIFFCLSKWILEEYVSKQISSLAPTSKYIGIWFCSYYETADREVYSIMTIRKHDLEMIDYELCGQELVEVASGRNKSRSRWISNENGTYSIRCEANVHTRERVHIDVDISKIKRKSVIARLFNLSDDSDIAEGYIYRYTDFGNNQNVTLNGQIFLISPDEVEKALGNSKHYGSKVYSTENCHKLVNLQYKKRENRQHTIEEEANYEGSNQKSSGQSTGKMTTSKKSNMKQKSQKDVVLKRKNSFFTSYRMLKKKGNSSIYRFKKMFNWRL